MIGSFFIHVEKILSNELVALLLRGPLHIRGLAEALQENHTTVGNKLRVLTEGNVVDFTTEGKNKVFFLKKSIEARNYAMMAELYKESKAITTYPVLRKIIHAVLELPDVRLALLFGSYAKGSVNENSDIDLFIETGDARVKEELEARYSMLSVKTGGFNPDNPLVREMITDHIIIRGVEDYFEKIRIFE